MRNLGKKWFEEVRKLEADIPRQYLHLYYPTETRFLQDLGPHRLALLTQYHAQKVCSI